MPDEERPWPANLKPLRKRLEIRLHHRAQEQVEVDFDVRVPSRAVEVVILARDMLIERGASRPEPRARAETILVCEPGTDAPPTGRPEGRVVAASIPGRVEGADGTVFRGESRDQGCLRVVDCVHGPPLRPAARIGGRPRDIRLADERDHAAVRTPALVVRRGPSFVGMTGPEAVHIVAVVGLEEEEGSVGTDPTPSVGIWVVDVLLELRVEAIDHVAADPPVLAGKVLPDAVL